MTRPRPAAERFVAALPRIVLAQVTPIFSPLIKIVPLGARVDLPGTAQAIFTSAHGVACTAPGAGRVAYCIGTATTDAARAAGWAATPCGPNADALVAHLVAAAPSAPLVHVSGRHTRGAVVARLSQAGLHARHVVAYDQVAQSLSTEARVTLDREPQVIVPLFSPRTASQFAAQCPKPARCWLIALSAAVADAASDGFAGCRVAQQPDADAMHAAIGQQVTALTSG